MSISMVCRFVLVSSAMSSRAIMRKVRPIELYTYGAAKPTAKKWPRQGCFVGQRAENEDYILGHLVKDMVTWLMASYRHPEMETVRLFGNKSLSEVKPCGWLRNKDPEARNHGTNIPLHDNNLYVARAMEFGGQLGVVADVGLRYSYEIKPPLADIRAKGWGLVDSAVVKRVEVAHLLQEPRTLECVLTFEGTDRSSEWFKNIKSKWFTFCGFGFVHHGFRDVLLSMCNSNEFQTLIRPKLGYCSKISVLGHSLGGAMASLWAGCVLSGNTGRTDYENLKINWQTPRKLPTK